ncbi:MAG: DNA alkylation repair protein [Candidatus Portnoybacteria bacterium]|nr:DNA alkylation repair protein [Candidatus Portnoybacteria bacterium]
MSNFAKEIHSDLKKAADRKTKKSFQRFFKKPVKCHGVKGKNVDKIAADYWKKIAHLPKKQIFEICEELYRSDYAEEAAIVAFWGTKFNKFTTPKDLAVFKKWINKYVNNWAKCDGFCNHTIGDFVQKFPDSIKEIKSWGESNNGWMRRASAVSLIIPAKRGKLLKDVFEIADTLLLDDDEMVQKGYGWLLKEASRLNVKPVFDYVMKKKSIMPRTALRYAIELMPANLKLKAMRK